MKSKDKAILSSNCGGEDLAHKPNFKLIICGG